MVIVIIVVVFILYFLSLSLLVIVVILWLLLLLLYYTFWLNFNIHYIINIAVHSIHLRSLLVDLKYILFMFNFISSPFPSWRFFWSISFSLIFTRPLDLFKSIFFLRRCSESISRVGFQSGETVERGTSRLRTF